MGKEWAFRKGWRHDAARQKSSPGDAENAERYGPSHVAANGRCAEYDEDDEGVWQDGGRRHGRHGRPWGHGPCAAPEHAEDDGRYEEGPEVRLVAPKTEVCSLELRGETVSVKKKK